MGKKIMDIKTGRDASRGRKSKAGGGKKSKATQEYTPLFFSFLFHRDLSRFPCYYHYLHLRFFLFFSLGGGGRGRLNLDDHWLQKSFQVLCKWKLNLLQVQHISSIMNRLKTLNKSKVFWFILILLQLCEIYIFPQPTIFIFFYLSFFNVRFEGCFTVIKSETKHFTLPDVGSIQKKILKSKKYLYIYRSLRWLPQPRVTTFVDPFPYNIWSSPLCMAAPWLF